MNITNKSGKIVNIGKKAIMPGETYSMNDTDAAAFTDNSAIELLAKHGFIAVSTKKAAAKADAAAKKAAEEAAAAKAAEEAAAKKDAEGSSK